LIFILSPSNNLGGLKLYSISTDNLGSALPKLLPHRPEVAGLPEKYHVGLWTYCAKFENGKSKCPNRSLLPPIFYFNLRDRLLNDLIVFSPESIDVRLNIFLPTTLYRLSSLKPSLTVPEILSYAASLLFLYAVYSSAKTVYYLSRPSSFSARGLVKASRACAWCLMTGTVLLGIMTVIILCELNKKIHLGYKVASGH
ncbi:hypothetical protein V1511DRAFT_449976, partial [Dipodascopsis uninucleata]